MPKSRAALAFAFVAQTVFFAYAEAISANLTTEHPPGRVNFLAKAHKKQHNHRGSLTLTKFGEKEVAFNEIVARHDDKELTTFVTGIVKQMGGSIEDEGKLAGAIPYYSGSKATQSFWRLLEELHTVSNSSAAWVKLPANTAMSMFASFGAEFDTVVEHQDNEGMVRLVHKLLASLGGGVLDDRALIGFVPFFSGAAGNKPFHAMVEELVAASKQQDSWLQLPPRAKQARDPINFLAGKLNFAKNKPVTGRGIHDVVGDDGVLQIVLKRAATERADVSTQVLASAGIKATRFSATDVKQATQGQLSKSCPLNTQKGTPEWCTANGKVGPGCLDTVAQAITDSHRRALVAAASRGHNWTMIIEDDVVPVHPEDWATNFQQSWKHVPQGVGIVRLARCVFEGDLGPVRKRNTTVFAGGFQLVDWPYWTDSAPKQRYYTGGCTTGYMVHKDIIPELLGLFPCCCPIDCCFENQLFYSAGKNGAEFRGEEIMTNLDHWDTREYAKGFAGFMQEGVMVQDNREIASSRPEWVDPRKVGGNWKATTRSDGK